MASTRLMAPVDEALKPFPLHVWKSHFLVSSRHTFSCSRIADRMYAQIHSWIYYLSGPIVIGLFA